MTTFALPRADLGTFPTPLAPARRLSDALGVEVWLKRDDLTGLGLGGNKVRALEYLIGDAEAAGADCIVTGGGPHSNWVMLAALAGITRGLEVHVCYFGAPVDRAANLTIVARLPGVDHSFTGDPVRASVDGALSATAAHLDAIGRRPYVIGRGGAGPVGALGYLGAVAEIDDQVTELGIEPTVIWTATGSCGTQAGLVAGQALSARRRQVVGVSVHRPVEECRQRIEKIAAGALDLLGGGSIDQVDWTVLGDQLDRDDAAERRVLDAATLMAKTEGVFLDPEFGAPAFAEFVSRVPTIEGPVVFVVTGGGTTLFDGGIFG